MLRARRNDRGESQEEVGYRAGLTAGTVSRIELGVDRNTGHRTLVQLLDPQLDGVISPLIREPMGGAWIASIADQEGVETVLRVYRSKASDPTAADLAASLGTTPQGTRAQMGIVALRLPGGNAHGCDAEFNR